MQGSPAHAGHGLGQGQCLGSSGKVEGCCSVSALLTLLQHPTRAVRGHPLTLPGEPVQIFPPTEQVSQAGDPDGTGGFPYLQQDFCMYSSRCSAEGCPELTHFAICMSFTGAVSLFMALNCSVWLYAQVSCSCISLALLSLTYD